MWAPYSETDALEASSRVCRKGGSIPYRLQEVEKHFRSLKWRIKREEISGVVETQGTDMTFETARKRWGKLPKEEVGFLTSRGLAHKMSASWEKPAIHQSAVQRSAAQGGDENDAC